MRVLTIDAGMTMGYGALGGERPPASGSFALRGGPRSMGKTMRHADEIVRQLILRERPDVIGFATPFVGKRTGEAKFIKGKFVPGKVSAIQPDSIRPLFGLIAKVEEIAEELKIRCVEVPEPTARRAFMTKVPRKSAEIKYAVRRMCQLMGWPCPDDHAGDALCIASWILESLDRKASHQQTPLFSTARH